MNNINKRKSTTLPNEEINSTMKPHPAPGGMQLSVFPLKKKHLLLGLTLTDKQLQNALTWIKTTMLLPGKTDKEPTRFLFDGKQPKNIVLEDMMIMIGLIKDTYSPDVEKDGNRFFFVKENFEKMDGFNKNIGPIVRAAEAIVKQYINPAWFVSKSTIIYSTAGGSDQGWHCDDCRDVSTPAKADKVMAEEGPIGSVMIGLMEGTVLDVMYNRKKTTLKIHPGHMLVFDGSLMHRGCGYAKDNVRLHLYMTKRNVDMIFSESVTYMHKCKMCAQGNMKDYVTLNTKTFTKHLDRTHNTTLTSYKKRYGILKI